MSDRPLRDVTGTVKIDLNYYCYNDFNSYESFIDEICDQLDEPLLQNIDHIIVGFEPDSMIAILEVTGHVDPDDEDWYNE